MATSPNRPAQAERPVTGPVWHFTITDGKVVDASVSVGNVDHGYTFTLPRIPTSSFAVSGDTVTETIVFGNAVETLTFTAGATAGDYRLTDVSRTMISDRDDAVRIWVNPFDQQKFTIGADGKIVSDDAHVQYSVLANGYVLETRAHDDGTSFELYCDGNGDGIYTEIAHGQGNTVDLVAIQAQLSTAMIGVL